MERSIKPRRSITAACLDSSQSILEGSPDVGASTPISFISRKRKACFDEHFQSPPDAPQFSSTLNESLLENLEKFHLQNESLPKYHKGNFYNILESDRFNDSPLFDKISKDVDFKFKSAPNTPEKQISTTANRSKKANTSSFIKNFSQVTVNTQSPLNKEAYDILYPDLPPLESQKKLFTPQKGRDRLERNAVPVKKCLFSLSKKEVFRKVVTNPIVMRRILKDLSNGDLYRLSQASNLFKNAILTDCDASMRFIKYMRTYHNIKENYKITPPSSPEKADEEPGSVSPTTRKHQEFWEMASELNKNQHLVKCPMCSKAAVVENSIAYCQRVSCGYIYCRKCYSFAYNPKDFKDKCNYQSRSFLRDLNNSASSGYITDTTGSFLLSSLSLNLSSKSDISGIFSECENSSPKQNVKKNLSQVFNGSTKRNAQIFANNNRIATPTPTKRPARRSSLVPMISTVATPQKSVIEKSEPCLSPPRTKQFAACSKQSKRNLKRLTH